MSQQLRWEPQRGGGAWAYSGEIVVGMVGRRDADPPRWWYATHSVSMRWTAKGDGEVASRAAAKHAIERAWAKWLDRAGLEPRKAP